VGFAFRTVVVREIQTDKNSCRAADIRTNEMFEVGLKLRGDSAVWPQVGDAWLIDRSMGYWALKCKITGTSPPIVTGARDDMDKDVGALVTLLAQQGMVGDFTAAATTPTGWQTPSSWLNGWVTGHATAPTVNAAFRFQRRPGHRVEFNGWAHGGTSSNYTKMFTVPSGFIPLYDQILSCYRDDVVTPCGVKILGSLEGANAGAVEILSGSSTTIAGVNLQIQGTYPLD
jgi:hypothetical protein